MSGIEMSPERFSTAMDNQAEQRVRYECLRLAHGDSNRATANEQGETSEAVVNRARLYADFVLGKGKSQ